MFLSSDRRGIFFILPLISEVYQNSTQLPAAAGGLYILNNKEDHFIASLQPLFLFLPTLFSCQLGREHLKLYCITICSFLTKCEKFKGV